MSRLLAWLDNPAGDRGVRFATREGDWRYWSYQQLAARARHYGQALTAAGVEPGDVVTLVEDTGPDFIGLLFATMRLGAVASPLAPPPSFGDRQRYAEHLRAALHTSTPRVVVHDPALTEVAALCAREQVPVISRADLYDGTGRPPPPAPARSVTAGQPAGMPSDAADPLALLQFTSGTSGRARAVRIPHTALAANVEMIQHWLRMRPDDPTASWLPVHHDMGLVGCLLAPVTAQTDLWLMPPGEFIRRPARYLECFGRHGARLTAMPAFGLAHIVRRVSPEALRGLDFSRWRAVIVGAERVPESILEQFANLCAPHGLSRSALLPAYGLAEATLAVTGLPLATGWRTVLHEGGPVVGCGTPLPGVTVQVLGPDGQPVAEGITGEIVVGGKAVCAGYAGSPEGGTAVTHRQVHTGDAGFLRDGELFVIGRLGDSIKQRGRALYAEDVEAAAQVACDAPPGRIIALLGQVGPQPQVVLVLEHPRPQWPQLARQAAAALAEDLPVRTVVVPSGHVPRTSSGKPRRRQMWQDYHAGRLPVTG